MEAAEMWDVLDLISYKDWTFVRNSNFGNAYLQVVFPSPAGKQHGRKWYISSHMTRSELVQTALKAVIAAEEHEAREAFTYRGRHIFGPHFDVEALVKLCDADALDGRKEPA